MTKLEQMREAFSRLEGSGLSMKAFARREGIAYTAMQYWRRKFREDATEKVAVTSTTALPTLSPVHVIPDAKLVESKSKGFEVWVANGISLDEEGALDGSVERGIAVRMEECWLCMMRAIRPVIKDAKL